MKRTTLSWCRSILGDGSTRILRSILTRMAPKDSLLRLGALLSQSVVDEYDKLESAAGKLNFLKGRRHSHLINDAFSSPQGTGPVLCVV